MCFNEFRQLVKNFYSRVADLRGPVFLRQTCFSHIALFSVANHVLSFLSSIMYSGYAWIHSDVITSWCAFTIPHEALGIRQTDQSCQHEVWLHLDFVGRRSGQSHHERHDRRLLAQRRTITTNQSTQQVEFDDDADVPR